MGPIYLYISHTSVTRTYINDLYSKCKQNIILSLTHREREFMVHSGAPHKRGRLKWESFLVFPILIC